MRSLPGGRISPVDLRKPPIAQQTTTTTAPPGNASTLSIASSLHDRSLNRSRSKFIWCAFCTSALPCQCCPTTLTQWTSSVANCHIAFMSAAFQAASHLSKTVRTFESLLSSFEAIIAVLRITGSAVGSYQAVIVCICHCRLFLAAAASRASGQTRKFACLRGTSAVPPRPDVTRSVSPRRATTIPPPPTPCAQPSRLS